MENKASIKMIVAHNVRKYRKLNNMTQAALAELADISNTYIANIECGQTWISDKTVEKIARALHIEAYLFFMPDSERTAISDRQLQWQKNLAYLHTCKETLQSYINELFTDMCGQLAAEC